jgi:hypothetical protein
MIKTVMDALLKVCSFIIQQFPPLWYDERAYGKPRAAEADTVATPSAGSGGARGLHNLDVATVVTPAAAIACRDDES